MKGKQITMSERQMAKSQSKIHRKKFSFCYYQTLNRWKELKCKDGQWNFKMWLIRLKVIKISANGNYIF